jgi:alanine racemase
MSTRDAGHGTARFVRAEAIIDLAAIRANRAHLQQQTNADVMVVVKADAYGHGILPVARTLRQEGVTWLGVALPSEAMALREAGDTGRILAWLTVPGDADVRRCVAAGVDLGVSALWLLEEIAEYARALGVSASVHLKVDTGLGRAGSPTTEWPGLLEHARQLEVEGVIRVQGVWSHLAAGEDADHPSTAEHVGRFSQATLIAAECGVQPPLRHLANSGAVLSGAARTHGFDFELVRSGIAVYGITPGTTLGSSQELGITPAMTLVSRLAQVKQVPLGHGVSYGHIWRAPTDTHLGLVPVGYADGIPRTAEGAHVLVAHGTAWRRCPVVGRIAMDQFVIDLGVDDPPEVGSQVIIFGPGDQGEPTAEDWAQWSRTIGYEIVTRLGGRIERRYVDSQVTGHEQASETD